MAIYHCSIKIISRGKGKSAIAAAAYRSGEKITNEYDGEVHDYTRKGGVVHTEILLPENAPQEYLDRSTLWNAIEKFERYKTAQLAREIEIALPAELTREQNISLVRRYVKETFVDKGMCADICLHDTGKGNPHAHVMLTMRPINADGTWGAKVVKINKQRTATTDWDNRDKAEEWRKTWAAYANGALRIAGVLTEDNILDHRSYERQGIEQKPTVHLGPYASGLEQRGIRTERGDMNRQIEISNAELRQIRARIKKLQKWLGEERKAEPPTVFDVVTAILNGGDNRSPYAKLRDLKLAAKTQLFMEQNHLLTITDLRGKVADYYDERKVLSDKLAPFKRRINTLDLHIQHSGNFNKYRDYKTQYEKLYAEYKTAQKSTGLFAKGKAQKALDAANGYADTYRVEIGQFETAEKHLRDVLQKRFDPAKLPTVKWRQERETLAQELGGLNTEYELLKDKVREVEAIRRCAEEVQRAVEPREKKREQGMEI